MNALEERKKLLKEKESLDKLISDYFKDPEGPNHTPVYLEHLENEKVGIEEALKNNIKDLELDLAYLQNELSRNPTSRALKNQIEVLSKELSSIEEVGENWKEWYELQPKLAQIIRGLMKAAQALHPTYYEVFCTPINESILMVNPDKKLAEAIFDYFNPKKVSTGDFKINMWSEDALDVGLKNLKPLDIEDTMDPNDPVSMPIDGAIHINWNSKNYKVLGDEDIKFILKVGSPPEPRDIH